MAETLTTRTVINTGGTNLSVGVSDRGVTYGDVQLVEPMFPDDSGVAPVTVFGARAPANSADLSVTTGGIVLAAAVAARSSVVIENKGSVDVFYGPTTGLTVTNYFGRVQPGDTHILYREDGCYVAWSAKVASGTCAVHVGTV